MGTNHESGGITRGLCAQALWESRVAGGARGLGFVRERFVLPQLVGRVEAVLDGV